MIWILSLLLSVYGLSNAIMDVISFRFESSVFSKLNRNFWDPQVSWINKWKLDDRGKILERNGKKVEKFLLSSTALVWMTDAWHLFKAIGNLSILVTILLLSGWKCMLIAFIAKSLAFNLGFEFIFINRKFKP